MAQFKFEEPDIEVNGATILAFVNGMGVFKKSALKILKDNGISDLREDEWYPAQNYLNAFKIIAEKLGAVILNRIGKTIPDTAKWPLEIKTIEDALESIDVAYHINHGKNKKPLFDPETKEMREGIGHYKVEKINKNSVKIICDNPYPCDFDMGIIEATALKFKPKDSVVKVYHEGESCRKRGDKSCIYVVTW